MPIWSDIFARVFGEPRGSHLNRFYEDVIWLVGSWVNPRYPFPERSSFATLTCVRTTWRACATTVAGPQPQVSGSIGLGWASLLTGGPGAAGAAGPGHLEDHYPNACLLRLFSHTHFSSLWLCSYSPSLFLFFFSFLLLSFILVFHNLPVLICLLLLCLNSLWTLLSKTNLVSTKLLPVVFTSWIHFLPFYLRIWGRKEIRTE